MEREISDSESLELPTSIDSEECCTCQCCPHQMKNSRLINAGDRTLIKETRRALLIGINYFGTSSQLAGCINDIINVEQYLRTCGFTEFVVLKDDGQSLQPTKINILNALRDIVSKTKYGDYLYVHYSGHGSQLRDLNGDEKDNMDECICPVDYSSNGFIGDDELSNILVKNLVTGAKLRVCFDSCHSGSALDLPIRWASNRKFDYETRPQPLGFENKIVIGKDVVFISGCMDMQTSADSYFNGQSAGAMTWALLKTLWDFKKSGKTWIWKELIQNMRFELRKERYDQIPQMGLTTVDQISRAIDLL